MESPEEYSIHVQNLTKTFGRITAIHDVSFSLKKGEVVGFLGPNGAGKSTTMKILTGLMPANSGSAYICGIPVATHAEEAKRHIGYMPENNPLPTDMRVAEYLRFRGKLKGLRGKKLRERIDYVLELCDLQRARKRVIGGMSKGYRQRIGIAEAILSEPEVIIMDEPTIGLDPHQILKIRDLIASLRGRMSVIISSHILPEIELTCDRVIIINRGYIVASGTPGELRKDFLPEATLHLELKGPTEQLNQTLSEVIDKPEVVSLGPAKEDGYYSLVLKSGIHGGIGEQLIDYLAKHPDYSLRSLSHTTATLEDIFLAATKRSWEILSEITEHGLSHPPFDPRAATAAQTDNGILPRPQAPEEGDPAQQAPAADTADQAPETPPPSIEIPPSARPKQTDEAPENQEDKS